ncbi:hypothetical protein [Neisseria lactamica]|uniref:hypothetical protein n=1 Tax=Neisseria lactamica TaxID=486 RepID=UPI000E591E29|nr:hypothetical protein [Neisseria lactamica]
MPSERTNSLQTAFCRQTDPSSPLFSSSLCKNPKIQNHRKLSKKQKPSTVIPAQAGIQSHGNLSEKPKLLRRHSHESENPKPREFIGKTETSPPSFPRKRESKATGIYRKNRNFSAVIPAQAGI